MTKDGWAKGIDLQAENQGCEQPLSAEVGVAPAQSAPHSSSSVRSPPVVDLIGPTQRLDF